MCILIKKCAPDTIFGWTCNTQFLTSLHLWNIVYLYIDPVPLLFGNVTNNIVFRLSPAASGWWLLWRPRHVQASHITGATLSTYGCIIHWIPTNQMFGVTLDVSKDTNNLRGTACEMLQWDWCLDQPVPANNSLPLKADMKDLFVKDRLV